MNNVILPLAQEIEDLHHGQGVWAFSAASKGSGLKHFGMRMKEYALVSKKIFTEGCEAVKSPASEPAPRNARIVRKFLDNFLPSWSKSEMKIALRRLTSLGDIINRLDKSALLRELKLAFGKMCADDVVKTWIPPRQLNEINVHDAFNTAETIVMGSERVISKLLQNLLK